MVLAAGLGLRLRPITDTRPKPLVSVAGRTMLDRVLDHMTAAGVTDVVVNCHYLADMIEAHLARHRSPRIAISREDDLLDTGGGVVKALPLLGAGPFHVANADVIWTDGADRALGRLAAAWRDDDMDALLLLQPAATAVGYDGRGDFQRDDAGRLRRRDSDGAAPHVFTGVQILHPRLFDGAPAGAFSLNLLYDRANNAGRLFGLVHDGAWYHVGTPAALDQAARLLDDASKGRDPV